MPEPSPGPPRPASFLLTLIRRGAPAMATATNALSDEVADPTPMRALRRISHIDGPIDVASNDGLLLRAARYIVLVPLLFRVVAVPGAMVVFLLAHGRNGAVPVVAVTAVSVVLNVFGTAWLLRSAPFRPGNAGVLIGIDVLFTLVMGLVLALTVPSEALADAMAVSGKQLIGCVGVLSLAMGLPRGIALALVSFPVRLLGTWLNGHTDIADALSGYSAMLGVLYTAGGALIMIGLGTRLALAYGIRNGRSAERARQQRMLHDTVLQTLETISLKTPGDAEQQLADLRGLARAQAIQLRQTLETSDDDEGSRPLGEKLATLAAEMARDGLRAQLVIAELDDDTLSEVRQIAIRDAVREALRNTMKHSGTDQVVVRMEQRDGGLAVITRDHGAGFSTGTQPPGFGISESINARLAEVGGTAIVESSPGNGTRVTLWVPF
ncbi:MAG: histidine kinase [Amycolatopsis sp.]|uniref:sensor histidine kinase n=1 Tax=Amycolatopsis sp. TaxID=37632 RepID=UPI00260E1EE4|nr:ATP-binding protein [Amycolatopsis sp.]MCU1685703.1 histidine kinase [Amycolatopsis sp.]